MVSDRTQQQSPDEVQKARELSLKAGRPPSEVAGYRFQNLIGSGAYGEVWLATNLKTGRPVAVKFFTGRSAADVRLMAQEVERLIALTADSRYVVQLLDIGLDATPPFYVMDYIEQGSLENRLQHGSGLPKSEAIELFEEVATGMMHLHAKGILHCDLKPGNVLLDQAGKPRVADFGQSRLKTDQTSALGTLFYMAPEQADMNAIPDVGWDVYGLGALLFTMLTGRPPFYTTELAAEIESKSEIGERLALYRRALRNAAPPTAHRKVPGVDRSLAEIVDRCLVVDPKKRYRSVQSILLALRQRESTRARRPLMLLGLIGPLLLMGVVSSFGWWAFRQAISQTNVAVKAKAEDSNRFAAQLAARSAAAQIDEHFRVVTKLTRSQEFLDTFDLVIADRALADLRFHLADPRSNSVDGIEVDDAIGVLRKQFREDETRQQLQKFLQRRIEDPDNEFPEAASWFVCDRYGNQIASVFASSDKAYENVTLGGNYAFRTYFSGDDFDLPLEQFAIAPELQNGPSNDQQREQIATARRVIGVDSAGNVTNRPHLSAVFRSQQTQNWKVAFSAPIVRNGKVAGIVATTLDLGNLIDFPNPSPTQYAMLVDGRRGEFTGAILEHPLFGVVMELNGRLPDELAEQRVNLDLAKESLLFRDPVGKSEWGRSKEYGRDSIVSNEPVMMEDAGRVLNSAIVQSTGPASEGTAPQLGQGAALGAVGIPRLARAEPTGLFVLAVQDYENVLADVRELGNQLSRLAVLAGLMLIAVAIAMWLFVNQMLKESRERLNRGLDLRGDSAGALGSSIAAQPPQRGGQASWSDSTTDEPPDPTL